MYSRRILLSAVSPFHRDVSQQSSTKKPEPVHHTVPGLLEVLWDADALQGHLSTALPSFKGANSTLQFGIASWILNSLKKLKPGKELAQLFDSKLNSAKKHQVKNAIVVVGTIRCAELEASGTVVERPMLKVRAGEWAADSARWWCTM